MAQQNIKPHDTHCPPGGDSSHYPLQKRGRIWHLRQCEHLRHCERPPRLSYSGKCGEYRQLHRAAQTAAQTIIIHRFTVSPVHVCKEGLLFPCYSACQTINTCSEVKMPVVGWFFSSGHKWVIDDRHCMCCSLRSDVPATALLCISRTFAMISGHNGASRSMPGPPQPTLI